MNTRTLLGALCACLLATPTLAQTEIKFGHVGEPGSLFAQSADEFAKRANAKLGNKAKVVVYGSSQAWAATRSSSRSSSSARWTSPCPRPSCPRKPTSSASSRCPTW